MPTPPYDSPLFGATTREDSHRRFAVELRRSREALIRTFRALPPVCSDHVWNGEAPEESFLRHKTLEACFGRLRAFHSNHDHPAVSCLFEQASRSRRRMNHAREAMVVANLGIVPHVVRPFRNRKIPFEDLVQDGYIGLLEAVDRFDPNRGAKFSTYACFWIRRALNDAFSFRARLIRLPDWVRRDLLRLRETTQQLMDELDRPPTDAEIAGRTGLSVRKIKGLRHVAPEPKALEDIATNRDEGWQSVVAGFGAHDPFEETLKGEMHEQAGIALKQLNPRERHIIKLRFGFDEDDGKTLQEIADTMGVSRERIRQIESVALDKVARWAKRVHVRTG